MPTDPWVGGVLLCVTDHLKGYARSGIYCIIISFVTIYI
jgi:hypothetical protein